jgi:hypothetical protein
MIISGGSRRGAVWFSQHFVKTEQGQTVSFPEVRGLAGDNIPYWFAQMRAMAMGTKCDNFFYHSNINPREDEHLTEEQWEKATDALEHALGLDGHARFVVEHTKNGREHRHIVWSRVDPDTMTAVSDSKTYAIHMRTADALEKEFGHEATPRGRGGDGPNPKNHEVFRGKESGISPYDVKAEITALYRESDTGPAFAAALAEHDYILTTGRRGFLVVDRAGDEHLLARRVAGAKTADIEARLATIDREALPSLEEARKLVRERTAKREADPTPEQPGAVAPGKRTDPRAFELLAEELVHAVKQEAWPKDPLPADIPAPSPEPSTFGHFVREAVTVAEDAAPAVIAATEAMHGQELHPQELSEGLTAFARFAQKLKGALGIGGHDPTAAESIDPLRAGPRPPMAAALEFPAVWDVPGPQPPRSYPVAPDTAQTASGVVPGAEPTEFERLTTARTDALRASGGDGHFFAEGVDWLAGKVHHWSEPPPTDRALTPFDRATQETTQALRDNGGEPYTEAGESFWKRSIALLAEARERLTERLKEPLQAFAERILRNRNNDQNDHGRER